MQLCRVERSAGCGPIRPELKGYPAYELAAEASVPDRVIAAFTELALAV